VQRYIESKPHLLIIPDHSLHLLPFQALVTEADASGAGVSYLIQKHTITYAPSSGIFGMLQSAKTQTSRDRLDLMAFAPVDFPSTSDGPRLSSLPGTINEVKSIAALFDPARTRLRTFALATKQTVLSEALDQFRFIHFATHGFVNAEDLDACSIVLRGDSEPEQVLRTSDIAHLKLDADLVVLSACETALGEVKYGEGVLGLVRAFYCAGARAVCASMWKVDDAATAFLMARFYENIVKNGLSTAAALQSAQLSLIDSRNWSSPKFWAAFVLSGANQSRPPSRVRDGPAG
jgi:CHAT domain-containing protein